MARQRVSRKERARILADSEQRALTAAWRAVLWALSPEGTPYGSAWFANGGIVDVSDLELPMVGEQPWDGSVIYRSKSAG